MMYYQSRRGFMESMAGLVGLLFIADQAACGGKFTDAVLKEGQELAREAGLPQVAETVGEVREGLKKIRDVTGEYVDKKISEGTQQFQEWGSNFFGPALKFAKSLFQLTHIVGDIFGAVDDVFWGMVSQTGKLTYLLKKSLSFFGLQSEYLNKTHDYFYAMEQTALANNLLSKAHIQTDWQGFKDAYNELYVALGTMKNEANADFKKAAARLPRIRQSFGTVYAAGDDLLDSEDIEAALAYGRSMAAENILNLFNGKEHLLFPRPNSSEMLHSGFAFTLTNGFVSVVQSMGGETQTLEMINSLLEFTKGQNFHKFSGYILNVFTTGAVRDARPIVTLVQGYLKGFQTALNDKEDGMSILNHRQNQAALQYHDSAKFLPGNHDPSGGMKNYKGYLSNGLQKCREARAKGGQNKPIPRDYRIIIKTDEDGRELPPERVTLEEFMELTEKAKPSSGQGRKSGQPIKEEREEPNQPHHSPSSGGGKRPRTISAPQQLEDRRKFLRRLA